MFQDAGVRRLFYNHYISKRMGSTGFKQLISAGYVIREVSWLPVKQKHIAKDVSLILTKPIHYAKRGNFIYVSSNLLEYLHTEGSAVDPDKPLQAICKFADNRTGDKAH